MAPRMAWDRPVEHDFAERGRVAAQRFRRLDRSWKYLPREDRMSPFSQAVQGIAGLVGRGELEVGEATPDELAAMRSTGGVVRIGRGASLTREYAREFELARFCLEEILRRGDFLLVEGGRRDLSDFDLQPAIDSLPHMDRMGVDPAALDHELDRMPALMERVVQRLAFESKDDVLSQNAPRLAAAYASGFASELGRETDAQETGELGPVTLPETVVERPAGDLDQPDEVIQALMAEPSAAEEARRAAGRIKDELQVLSMAWEGWNGIPNDIRLSVLDPAIQKVSRVLAAGEVTRSVWEEAGFEFGVTVKAAGDEVQGMLREGRQVAGVVLEPTPPDRAAIFKTPPDYKEYRTSRDIQVFAEARNKIIDAIEAQDPDVRIPNRDVVRYPLGGPKVFVDAENLSGGLERVPIVMQGIVQAMVESQPRLAERGRSMGIAYGAALSQELGEGRFAPAHLGMERVVDVSAVADIDLDHGLDHESAVGVASSGTGEAERGDPGTPTRPDPQTSVRPEPETPVRPEPETVRPEPETPVRPEPETPVRPEPETSVRPEPETPARPSGPEPPAPSGSNTPDVNQIEGGYEIETDDDGGFGMC